MQPDGIGEKGSIPTAAVHEISSDGGISWTACTGPSADLAEDTYLVRVSAVGTQLASDPQTIIIKYSPVYLITQGANGSWKLPDEEESGSSTATEDGSLTQKIRVPSKLTVFCMQPMTNAWPS